MGHKQSSRRNRSVKDHASSTRKNATRRRNFFYAVRRAPAKYFGDRTIENDPSMQQLQQDLLAFDDRIKQKCLPQRKHKQPKYSGVSYYEDEQYYDRNLQALSDDDESHLPSGHIDDLYRRKSRKHKWRCRYCAAENKSTAIECHECGEFETRF